MEIFCSFFTEAVKTLVPIYAATFAAGPLQDMFNFEKIRDGLKRKVFKQRILRQFVMGIFTPFFHTRFSRVLVGGIP